MKRFFLLLIVICMMFSTGCSTINSLSANYREIEQLRLVHTIGFDTNKDGLELSVCAGEQKNQGLTRLSASGLNISDTLATLQNYSNKEELYYAHTRYVLVGEEYAKQGLEDVLEYLESSNQLRSDLPIFIVRGGNASDLVLNAGGKEHGIYEVLEAVIRDCTQRGDSYPYTCGDIACFSAEYGSALACMLTATPTKEIDPSAEDKDLTPVVSGYGILKDGKLVGYISEDSAQCINLLLGELGTGDVTVELNGQPVSLRIKKAETSLKPSFGPAGTMTELTVGLTIEATMEEAEKKDKQDTEKLNYYLEEVITGWLNDILLAMHNTGCDFLGFGPQIAITHTKQWENNPVSWESQLKTLPMNAEVQCKITLGENEQRR